MKLAAHSSLFLVSNFCHWNFFWAFHNVWRYAFTSHGQQAPGKAPQHSSETANPTETFLALPNPLWAQSSYKQCYLTFRQYWISSGSTGPGQSTSSEFSSGRPILWLKIDHFYPHCLIWWVYSCYGPIHLSSSWSCCQVCSAKDENAKFWTVSLAIWSNGCFSGTR